MIRSLKMNLNFFFSQSASKNYRILYKIIRKYFIFVRTKQYRLQNNADVV